MTGARLLVTRPEPDAAATAAQLEALGIAPVVSPLMRRLPLAADLPPPGEIAALALTSANAVRALGDRAAPYRHLPAFAVGPATAAAARAAGFAEVAAGSGTVTALAGLIAARRPAGPVLYPAARYQSQNLEALAAPLGVTVLTRPVYEMRAAEALTEEAMRGLGDGSIGGVMLYSRRSAEIFLSLTAPLLPAFRPRLAALCISARAAEPFARENFSHLALADDPEEGTMMELARRFARQARAG